MTKEQLQALSIEDFQNYCATLYEEQDRRAKLASIPEDIKRLSNDFEDFGGDKAALVEKVNEVNEEALAPTKTNQ